MIIKKEELYEALKKECPGKYSVGLHGISLSRVEDFYGYDVSADPAGVSEIIADKIVRGGLRVESCRTINGTVAFFGRLDDSGSLPKTFRGLSSYRYGSDRDYIIVATPVELECTDGRTIYAGATNLQSKYKRHFDSTGSEVSTILDRGILGDGSVIDPKYILGRFKVIDDETIDLQINPEHLSKTGGKVSKEDFDRFIHRIRLDLFFEFPGIMQHILNKDLEKLRPVIDKLSYDPGRQAYLLETFEQLLEEDSVRDLTPEDLERLEALKNEFREAVKRNRKYIEEEKQRLARMANYSIEELKDFALNNHPAYFQEFPDTIRNDISLMRELTKTPGLNSYIVYYLGPDVRNDSKAMISLASNCKSDNFEDYLRDDWYSEPQEPNKSDLGYETIGLDVRTNPLFWETLNARILEINKEKETRYPFFDTEKEIRLASDEKNKKTQK